MSPTDDPQKVLEPRHANLLAAGVFILAALTLCWPMLAGRFLVGDDQYVAGYGFRLARSISFPGGGTLHSWDAAPSSGVWRRVGA